MQKTSSHSVLIIDPMEPSLMNELDRRQVPYDYRPRIEANEIPEVLRKHTILVLRSKIRLDRNYLKYAPKLELVVRAGSGMDNIDLEACGKAGVQCLNCPEGNRDAVGEQTIGMLLNLAARISKGNAETGKLIWDREGNRGFEIKGKTIGIIGYGNTGSAVARKLSGFDCRVLAYDKYKSGFSNAWAEEASYEQIQQEADVITFHIPLTPETKNWISKPFFDQLSKPVVLLNLSRGGIMKLDDVMQALEEGKIRSLGLDVLENENINSWDQQEKALFESLRARDNVIVTPHVGGWTLESYQRISDLVAAKIWGYIEKSIPFVKDEDNI